MLSEVIAAFAADGRDGDPHGALVDALVSDYVEWPDVDRGLALARDRDRVRKVMVRFSCET